MSRKTDPFHIELTPDLVVRAYRAGIFPMAEDASSPDVFWVSPEQRGILPLDEFHLPRRLARELRKRRFDLTVNRSFRETIVACGSRSEDEGNWINDEIVES